MRPILVLETSLAPETCAARLRDSGGLLLTSDDKLVILPERGDPEIRVRIRRSGDRYPVATVAHVSFERRSDRTLVRIRLRPNRLGVGLAASLLVVSAVLLVAEIALASRLAHWLKGVLVLLGGMSVQVWALREAIYSRPAVDGQRISNALALMLEAEPPKD